MHRPFVGVIRRGRYACVAFGFATALTLGFSASAGADDIACHGSENPAAKAAVKARPAPTPEAVAAALARVRVIEVPMALCPAIDEPAPTGGLLAAVDPATGELRAPTAEEMRSLRPARSPLERRATKSSASVVLPGGGEGMALGEEFFNDVAVRIAPDGTIVYECARSGEATKAPAASPKTSEEK
jgi:hypothetical protein